MENESKIAFSIVLGTTIVFLLIISIIFIVSKYQRKVAASLLRLQRIEHENQLERFRATINAEERQKQVIAQNLHDSVISHISEVQIILNRLASKQDHNSLRESLVYCGEKINDSVIRIREACYDLIPHTLKHLGLFKALEQQVDSLKNKVSAHCEIGNFIEMPAHWTPDVQVNILRIIQQLPK